MDAWVNQVNTRQRKSCKLPWHSSNLTSVILHLDSTAKWLSQRPGHILVLISVSHAWTSDWNMFMVFLKEAHLESFNLVCQLPNCCSSAPHLPSSINSIWLGLGYYKLHSSDSHRSWFSVKSWQEKETLFLSHILLLLLVFLELAVPCPWSKFLL